jgi:hypothetical protein
VGRLYCKTTTRGSSLNLSLLILILAYNRGNCSIFCVRLGVINGSEWFNNDVSSSIIFLTKPSLSTGFDLNVPVSVTGGCGLQCCDVY